MWYQNIHSPSFSFVTIHASDRGTDGETELRTITITVITDRITDSNYRQTDYRINYRQNYDSNTVRCIACSRTVKTGALKFKYDVKFYLEIV